jgi:hypothetical protein
MSDPSLADWLQLIRAEYLEIPALQLTRPQVQRLWGLDNQQCDGVLRVLTEARFLHLKPDGHYTRLSPQTFLRRSCPNG